MTVELRVNWILCDGYGLCSDLAPELIDVDDWRYPMVRPGGVPDELLDGARRAVDCCPMRALRFEPVSTPGLTRARARSGQHSHS
jgi:ferredoxin